MKIFKGLFITVAVLLGLWLVLEVGLRIYVESPLKTDFYSSITRDEVKALQLKYALKTAGGNGWAHLGWIADPDDEDYTVERWSGSAWEKVGSAEFGSFMADSGGRMRVMARSKQGGGSTIIGEADVAMDKPVDWPAYRPVIAGPWQVLFRPQMYGYYINDHALYRDAGGNWRLAGITHKSDGNFNEEKYFAVGVSRGLLPEGGMHEEPPVADFGELAWAPHVISENGTRYMFWSPHRLERMTSDDGITWKDKKTVIPDPYHKFFRDGMVFKVAEGQWLLYTTARDGFFSQVDIYQSFDLENWQYIGAALRSGWGSERNSPFASTESPFVLQYRGSYYLSLTYNNDTFFWNGLLLPMKVWPDRASYNDTLVFQSANPYDFGTYAGRGNTPSLAASLQAHGPEYVYLPDQDRWYITTAGWPWVSTLTSGEAAIAPLDWQPALKQ